MNLKFFKVSNFNVLNDNWEDKTYNENNLPWNIEKLSKYINIYLNIRVRRAG